MRIAISGHTGFIGSELTKFFSKKGYEVTGIGRKDFNRGPGHLAQMIESHDFLINLAGAPIIKRWTRKYSRLLWTSRIDTTALLREALAQCQERPGAFFSSSAVGIYSPEGIHTENKNRLDNDFLGLLCLSWEEEASKARVFCPTYIIRTGIILGNSGGALPQMALPFKLFAGGKIGNGKQMISWMHIKDYAEALHMLMQSLPEQEVFNFTAPNPVSNAEFSSVLAKTLHRPNYLPVPPFALKLLFGEGSVALLSGQNVLPENLQKAGYKFQFPEISDALKNLLQSTE
ncbi:MAG: TIGR01777 family oxidoreductase [Bacteroidales bacterium]|nr:TIGR01777 family oxidoreductase [Bacteroidales bacterium]